MKSRFLAALLAIATMCCVASRASAGGLFLSDRGTRPIARGNAFVAGADDPNAMWYNPAGIAYSGRQLLLDATLSIFRADFTRLDSGGNFQPMVSNNPSLMPIPGLAYTDHFGLRDFTFGLAFMAPNASLMDFPETINYGGNANYPAPQRYSLITMNGSLVAHAFGAVAWRPSFFPGFSIGVTGGIALHTLNVRTVLSSCDRVLCTQPENPEYDSLSEVTLHNAISPHISFGAIYARGIFRFGLSATMGYTVSGNANLAVRPPTAAAFDSAYVDGNRAKLSLDFPWQVRAGVEIRPIPGLRTELAFGWEGWSVQKDMTIRPDNVWLRGVTAIGDYQVGPVVVPRNMRDTYSIRLGTEYRQDWWAVRGGLQFETGAFDDSHLTVLTLDSEKVIFSAGAAFEVTKGVFIDVTVAHAVMFNRQVRNSVVPQANPIRPDPADPVYVGNGNYRMDATIVGLGLRWQFEESPQDVEAAERAAIEAAQEEILDASAPAEESTPSQEDARSERSRRNEVQDSSELRKERNSRPPVRRPNTPPVDDEVPPSHSDEDP